MRVPTILGGWVVLFAAAAAAAGCYTGGSALDGAVASAGPGGASTTVDGTEPAATVTGLPCDVAAVVANDCATCHGDRLSGGAPTRLLSHDDLTAVSGTGTLTVAQDSLARMKDPRNPMPPAGASPEAVKVVADWIAAGMPAGSCEATVGVPIVSEYDTALVCTSKTLWTRGDHESPEMHPGVACIECHDRERKAPSLVAAGTIYPTAHEPDDCNGIDGAKTTRVEITDATGKVFRTFANAVGNFYFEPRAGTMTPPLSAKVISGAKVRAMKDPVDSGDCNACHTEKGTKKAPGRVLAP